MHVAEIVPLKFLSRISENYYHMCLAQLVLKNDEYACFYKEMSDHGKYVIVDNGACEGETLSQGDLIKAYDIIRPTEIILPDVLFDPWKTLENVEYFFANHASELSKYNKMIVPQGREWMEWLWCLSEMEKADYFKEIKTIGIPKWLDGSPYSMRPYICKILKRDFPDKEIHLLGCGSNPSLIPDCRKSNPKVRGCDSAFAYLCSKSGVEVIDKSTPRPRTTIDFLNDSIEKSPLDRCMREFEAVVGVKNNKEVIR